MAYRIGIVAGILVLAFVVGSAWFAENKTEVAAHDVPPVDADSIATEHVDSTVVAAAKSTIDTDNRERIQNLGDAAGLFGRVGPAEIESAVLQRLAEQSDLTFVSINSVDCDLRTCNVVFSGVDVDPQHVGDYGDLLGVMMNPPWTDFQTTSGGIGTREISAGAREYVLGFTYVALVDANADPEIAAQQNAACAGAWARVTEQRGSDDYLRGAHERSAEWLEMSARVLGLDEAQRLADELRYGPLTRDCHAMPY